jgi:signal transduction histidine kinase/DNA-binding response OmpR family regulator/methyl-accepting chemotaxis protein
MTYFTHGSIKRKLMLITAVTSSLALLLASAGFVFYDLAAFRARMSQDLMTQAEIISANSMAALAFRDERTVSEFLGALRAKEEIETAAIYTPDGRVFAVYHRDPEHQTALPLKPGPAGYRFDDDALRVFHDIVLHEQSLGTLYIQSDMQQWYARLRNYTAIVGILMVGAALFALLLSSRMQRVISQPILDLERTMKTVSATKAFSLRATKTQDDEIGALIDGFNEMLGEIQRRDAALQSRTSELEQEVTERLRAQDELKTLNTTLEQRVAERSAAAEQRAEELARSKDALQRQTRILQSILDTMSDGVIVADGGGRVIMSNPAAAALLHLEVEDTLTSDWIARHGFYLPDMTTAYPHEQFPLIRAVAGAPVEGAVVYVLDDIKAPDGIWLSIDAMPLTDEGGILHNGVAILHNITAQKKVEEALLGAKDAAVAASLAKSQFLANMSHELRTPLNAIIGYSEMLQEAAEDGGDEASVPDLQRIHAAGKHLQTLIDDILDLSKIEAGKMELFLEFFEVTALVLDVAATVQPVVQKNGNVMTVRCADDLGDMHADLTRVRQVLFNLLSNAGKFTREGQVTVDVTRESSGATDWIRFQVRDTGIGMTAEQASRLFGDFTQVDASTTRKYGGTGLGLAISQRFSRMMGGDITVTSAAGAGSTFTLLLPETVAQANGQSTGQGAPGWRGGPSAGAAAGVNPPRPDVTVLVIDDDPDVRDLMSRLLTKEGFGVVLACDGAEGLERARQLRPTVITLDVVMPGADGWSILAALKSDPELSDIPVVMVTMTEDRRTAYALGACDYLVKPVDPARLATLLKRHSANRPGGSVLVIDDDPAARIIMRRLLTNEGMRVTEADGGRAAIDRLSQETPDLIVLDLVMPDMDGFEVLERLRESPGLGQIPVVVITAKDLSAEERTILNGSVGRVLRKTFVGCDELVPAVRACVRAQSELPAAG